MKRVAEFLAVFLIGLSVLWTALKLLDEVSRAHYGVTDVLFLLAPFLLWAGVHRVFKQSEALSESGDLNRKKIARILGFISIILVFTPIVLMPLTVGFSILLVPFSSVVALIMLAVGLWLSRPAVASSRSPIE